jgi:hypothetical protein
MANENSVEKKKRGRKAKVVEDEVVDVTIVQPDQPSQEKKKRGRKPKSVYNVHEIAVAPQSSSLSDEENVIVRLHVSEDKEFDSHEQPHAYNNDIYSTMHTVDESHPHTCTEDKEVDKDEKKIVDVLKDFEQKNKNNEWPSNTSTHCYWCCHRFDNAPFGIPVCYNNDVFEVFGCFCSLHCAAAYNFQSNESLDAVWERYNLINLLSRRLQLGRVVKPAPDKMTLKIFGGFLDIDEFRNFHKTHKVVNINFPPMTSLTQQIEEINDYELNNDLKFIPLDNERINRCKEKMIFKRTKPLVSEKSTLESSMNLKVFI